MSSDTDEVPEGVPDGAEACSQDRTGFINPVRMCAPIGAMIGTLGVHGGVPLIHGSNGCATYPRHEMNRHFEEPVETGVTSLTEGSTVFGGADNLIEGLENIYERVDPTMITGISTCLSETIGDDIEGIVMEYQATNPEVDVPILSVNAPSYVGTHITGMDNFVTEVVQCFPEPGKPTNRLNVIPGWVDPGDIREIRHILEEIGANPLWLTDYSDPLDGGLYADDPDHPPGGTPIEDLEDAANSRGTVALQKHVGGEGARILGEEYNQQVSVGPMPVGVRNTDRFVEAVTQITGLDRSERLKKERARLLDAIVDAHMYLSGLRVGVFGDPDWIEGITEFLAEAGSEPVHALTSFESDAWTEDMLAVADRHDLDLHVRHESDLKELEDMLDDEPVDLLVGPSKGKFLADEQDIPLVRTGFPVEDRFGYHRRATVGYRGSINLLDDVVNAFLRGGNERLVSNTTLDTDLEGGVR
ncbi:Nitrogenase molybdenum-iron protein beta chain [Halorhabdus sp. SVX81]|uniref:nitrogenase component 1 n=1 Tax=Halorhabdus sp. SVX81 TaxID=2978283 RepID=UPI0023DB3C7D|nr:nitrogenase component 1 [Halorhabdus sp. SVX81]WEL16777.1 Nitrogenase molybdenum-iron protein beta chain [Halorhabdus sp. SVX81]